MTRCARSHAARDVALPLDRSAAGVTCSSEARPGVFRRPEAGSARIGLRPGDEGVGQCRIRLLRAARDAQRQARNADAWAAPTPDAFSEEEATLLGHTSAQIATSLKTPPRVRATATVTQRAPDPDEKAYLERELLQGVQLRSSASSAALRRVLQAVKTVAPTDITVLLLG